MLIATVARECQAIGIVAGLVDVLLCDDVVDVKRRVNSRLRQLAILTTVGRSLADDTTNRSVHQLPA